MFVGNSLVLTLGWVNLKKWCAVHTLPSKIKNAGADMVQGGRRSGAPD